MLKARTNHASTALNGEIYAIGGEASLPVTLQPQVSTHTLPGDAARESSLPYGVSEPQANSP